MQQGWPILAGIMFIAPMDNRHHERVKREPLFRQSILISHRPILIPGTLQYALIDERPQSIRDDRARYSQAPLEILKPANTPEAVANDHERPTVAQYGDRASYGAFLVGKVIPLHWRRLLGNGEHVSASSHLMTRKPICRGPAGQMSALGEFPLQPGQPATTGPPEPQPTSTPPTPASAHQSRSAPSPRACL